MKAAATAEKIRRGFIVKRLGLGGSRCAEPKALALIPGADHFFLGREAEVAKAVVAFVMH